MTDWSKVPYRGSPGHVCTGAMFGLLCTCSRGHEGPHMAYGAGPSPMLVWERDGSVLYNPLNRSETDYVYMVEDECTPDEELEYKQTEWERLMSEEFTRFSRAQVQKWIEEVYKEEK